MAVIVSRGIIYGVRREVVDAPFSKPTARHMRNSYLDVVTTILLIVVGGSQPRNAAGRGFRWLLIYTAQLRNVSVIYTINRGRFRGGETSRSGNWVNGETMLILDTWKPTLSIFYAEYLEINR